MKPPVERHVVHDDETWSNDDEDEDAYYSEPDIGTTGQQSSSLNDDEFVTARFDEPFFRHHGERFGKKDENCQQAKSTSFVLWIKSEIVGRPRIKALETAPGTHVEETSLVPRFLEGTLFVGLALCIDALFHELTFMPLNVVYGLFRRISWPWHRPLTTTEAAELIRLSLLVINAYFVTNFVDFTTVYHFVRGQPFMKLYVLFNMLEISERLIRSFGLDLVDCLMLSALRSSFWDVAVRYVATLVYLFIHTSMHFVRFLLLMVAINSFSENIMFLLVITNNFGEIKSTTFKKYEAKGLFVIVASDIVERTYLFVDVCIVLIRMAASPRRDEYDWVNATYWLVVTVAVEVITDWIKYCFIAKVIKLPAITFRNYKHVLIQDVASSRLSKGPAFTGIYGFSHIPVRRVGFIALPLGSLVLTHMPLLFKCEFNHSCAIMMSVFILTFLMKVLMSILLVGYAMMKNVNLQDIPENLHDVKAL